MSNISQSGIDDDNYQGGYVSIRLAVAGSQIEAKVGASALEGRQELTLYNDGNDVIYYGPSGVTTSGANKGVPVEGLEFVTIPATDAAQVFLISSGSTNVIIQEWS